MKTWREKIGLPKKYPSNRTATGRSWDRIADADLTNPKFADTGTDWDSISDEVLKTYAETEAALLPAHKAGTLPSTTINKNGHEVEGVFLDPYKGAGKAWDARHQYLQLRHATNLQRGIDRRAKGELVLDPAHMAYWQPILEAWSPVELQFNGVLSPHSSVLLAAACDQALYTALNRFLPTTVCDAVRVDFNTMNHYGIGPDSGRIDDRWSLRVRVNHKQLANALLDIPPAQRDAIKQRLYGELRSMGLDVYDRNKRFTLEWDDFLIVDHLPVRLWDHPNSFCEIATPMVLNQYCRKNHVPPVNLEPFKEEASLIIAHRKEKELIWRAGR